MAGSAQVSASGVPSSLEGSREGARPRIKSLVRTTGIILVLALLLSTVVGLIEAQHTGPERGEVSPAPTNRAERAQDTTLVCLALVVGTATLAGAAWMKTLRHTLP